MLLTKIILWYFLIMSFIKMIAVFLIVQLNPNIKNLKDYIDTICSVYIGMGKEIPQMNKYKMVGEYFIIICVIIAALIML